MAKEETEAIREKKGTKEEGKRREKREEGNWEGGRTEEAERRRRMREENEGRDEGMSK